MRTFPKWSIFIGMFFVISVIVGSIADGVLAPTVDATSKLEALKGGNFLALKDIVLWQYPWVTGNWTYFILPFQVFSCVCALLILVEVALILRELARVL
jgi:hypothetical protein